MENEVKCFLCGKSRTKDGEDVDKWYDLCFCDQIICTDCDQVHFNFKEPHKPQDHLKK